jgi:hypothetical protein
LIYIPFFLVSYALIRNELKWIKKSTDNAALGEVWKGFVMLRFGVHFSWYWKLNDWVQGDYMVCLH